MPARTGQCGCCGVDAQVTRVLLSDGGVVGIVGLKQVFEQLYVMGRKGEAEVAEELLTLVKMRNYVASSLQERYKTALLREYAAFFIMRGEQSLGQGEKR